MIMGRPVRRLEWGRAMGIKLSIREDPAYTDGADRRRLSVSIRVYQKNLSGLLSNHILSPTCRASVCLKSPEIQDAYPLGASSRPCHSLSTLFFRCSSAFHNRLLELPLKIRLLWTWTMTNRQDYSRNTGMYCSEPEMRGKGRHRHHQG